MKPSDIWNLTTKAVGWLSHIHTVFDIGSKVFSEDEPPKDLTGVASGFYGILGHRDERAFWILLNQLEKADPGSREAILGFMNWHFHSGSGFFHKIASFWYSNQFRVFIVKMGTASSTEIGSKTQVVTGTNARGYTTRRRKVEKLFDTPTNNPFQFLKWMTSVIMDESCGELVDRYKSLVSAFKEVGIPHMPGNTNAVGDFLQRRRSGIKAAANKAEIRAHVRRQRRRESWIKTFLDYAIHWGM
ncbi:MAG: hypothetical protein ISR99_03025 [Parcubacteria group bacterium]|nr:hypothetical protein [Parcubacteria group bacterium]